MKCHEHEADLVDLARGVEASDESASLREHLETCPDCAARLARERQLTGALHTLARAADVPAANRKTEQQLLAAFDARVGAVAAAAPGRPWRASWYLAAAASLTLAVAGWWGMTRPTPRSPFAETPGNQHAAVAPAGTATVPVEPTRDPAGASSAAGSGTPPAPSPRPAAATRHRPSRAVVPAPANVDTTDIAGEFLPLPASDRLPGFESGMIVRVELPVSSLPAYGFPIMPDAPRTPVTADVVVGQDGQPRAIRLVSMETGPRRRQ